MGAAFCPDIRGTFAFYLLIEENKIQQFLRLCQLRARA